MAELSDKALALLEAQRTRYLDSFPEKAANLRRLWNSRHEGNELELIDAVHRIAGSAGLHAQDELQRLAVQCETTLRDSQSDDQAQQLAVTALLERLTASD